MTPFCFAFSKETLESELRLSEADYFYSYLELLRRELSQKVGKRNDEYKIIIVVENEYVDKYHLRDYSKYYAESFSREGRFTKRMHFFLSNLTKEKFEEKLLEDLSNYNKNNIKKIRDSYQASYLGYTIRKPIQNDEGYYLIGRTNLRPYLKELPNNAHRNYLVCQNECSLFGIRLKT